jgi:hypothetical protein
MPPTGATDALAGGKANPSGWGVSLRVHEAARVRITPSMECVVNVILCRLDKEYFRRI